MKLSAILFLIISTLFSVKASADSLSNQALPIHNHLRAQHQAAPLMWDAKLAVFAQQYANQCHFQHSHAGYGENLAAGYPTISSAIKAWYAEEKYYFYMFPGFSYKTGHFTQLVWRSSKRVGCGLAECDGKNGTPGQFLVCEYSPAGNVVNAGYFSANVLPAKKG